MRQFGLASIASFLALTAVSRAGLADQNSGSPAEPFPKRLIETFADPERFFELMFGKETEEDKQALANIEVSLREEQQMGQWAVEGYLENLRQRGIRVVSRGRDVRYLHDLVSTIRPLMDNRRRYRTITVYLVQSSRCDARSFPGGTLVFFRGLLETAGSEAALVGIVGHELSHLDRGHHVARLKRVKLAQRTFTEDFRQFSPERFFTAGTAMMRLFTRPFQPVAEAEADRDGARWAYQAGYDTREMARLLLRLGRDDGKPPLPIPSFLRSHPPAAERHKAILEAYQKLQEADPKDNLYVGRENLRRRVARARREFKQ